MTVLLELLTALLEYLGGVPGLSPPLDTPLQEMHAKEVGRAVIFVYDIFRPFLYISVAPSTISKVP